MVTDEVGQAGHRLMRIQFAMRADRWWEAREILPEAELNQDWRSLGYGSWDDYVRVALTTRKARHQVTVESAEQR